MKYQILKNTKIFPLILVIVMFFCPGCQSTNNIPINPDEMKDLALGDQNVKYSGIVTKDLSSKLLTYQVFVIPDNGSPFDLSGSIEYSLTESGTLEPLFLRNGTSSKASNSFCVQIFPYTNENKLSLAVGISFGLSEMKMMLALAPQGVSVLSKEDLISGLHQSETLKLVFIDEVVI